MTDSPSQWDTAAPPNESDTAEVEAKKAEFFEKFEWMLRPCSSYKDEHKECTSWRGRFHQYFIYGENLDCGQWREDYNNCQKWSWLKDKDAAMLIIKSEMKRHDDRMEAHLNNTTWTKRDKPPEDWNKPLPDFMVERNKGTYLELRAKEMREEEEAAAEAANPDKSGIAANTSHKTSSSTESLCSIM